MGRQCWREGALHRAGQPLGKRYIESFNARLRDELLNGAMFYTLDEVHVVIGWWHDHYNKLRPHSLGIPSTRSRDDHAKLAARFPFAPPSGQLGVRWHIELTSLPGHPSQAVHPIICQTAA